MQALTQLWPPPPPPPPHTHTDWGKNWDRTFTNPSCPILSKHPAGFKAMAALQDK